MAYEIHTNNPLPILRVARQLGLAELLTLADGSQRPSIAGGAYAINVRSIPGEEFPVSWPHRYTAADQTVTTTVTTGGFGDLLAGASQPGGFVNRWFIMAKIKAKTTTAATSVRYNLQVDSDTGFATNLQQIAEGLSTGNSIKSTFVLIGFMDDAATPVARYYRIVQTITGGGAVTFDADVAATPIS